MESVKNVAIVVAGGSGTRMGQDIPKRLLMYSISQCLSIHWKASSGILILTQIEVVCIEGWETMVEAYSKQFNIDKLKWIVRGGASVQESIRNGVEFLADKISEEDNVIIHDGIRPLIDADVLTDVIDVCNRYGNAVTSLPYNEQIFVISQEDASTTKQYVPREQLRRVSTPQAYRYGKLLDAYRKAFRENIGVHGSSYHDTMMVDLGETLHFAKGSDKNIKLTTKGDLELFKAYITADEDTWLK